jgi:hypothetical protein
MMATKHYYLVQAEEEIQEREEKINEKHKGE